jgi:hypothetical protein
MVFAQVRKTISGHYNPDVYRLKPSKNRVLPVTEPSGTEK